jgi:hypothetical protein
MSPVDYCTPEWLEASCRAYVETPHAQPGLENLTAKVFFRIKAKPAWGIENDILFGAVVDHGSLLELAFFSDEYARINADYIMAATPEEWKKILRKEKKLLGEFMLGKVTLEKGNMVSALGIIPYSPVFIDALTASGLRFPDEMSPAELESYTSYQADFRERLGV